ncbi:MAG TPA: type II secretion system F family protein [Pirellulales bacterium]|nr:type II secretion system F family protein [Pirellulales bacterium]
MSSQSDMGQTQGEDAAILGGAITSLVASGLPIEQGLRAAARELPPGRTAKALATVADKIERGEKLEVALADDTMPGHLRALVVGGLRTASLGRVLEEFVAAERHADDVHRRLMLAISYPAFLLLLMSGVFAFFCFGVVPGFVQLYDDIDADLPAATMALAQLSRNGPWMVIGNLAVLAAGWLFLALTMKLPELRTILVAVPLLGPVVRWAGLTRFLRLLALLLDTELPLPQALELAGRGCQDSMLDYASRKAAASVRAGATLSDALAARRQFPRSLGPIVHWGERAAAQDGSTTALSDALRITAEMFDCRLEAQLALLRAVVPPLAFVFVLWGSMFIVSATLLPMISLIERLT